MSLTIAPAPGATGAPAPGAAAPAAGPAAAPAAAAAPAVDLTTEPAIGTPEYETWLDAKARATLAAQTPAAPVRPPEVPEKFWDATKGVVDYVAMAKSYSELERKLSGGAAAAAPAAAAAAAAAAPAAAGAETPPAAAGAIDYAKYSQELADQGALSAASFAELEAKGMPKQMVEAYIAGQQALQATQASALIATVGGQQQFDAMKTWAVSNLTPAEIARFDKQVTADRDTAQIALEWLQSKYVTANGRGPKVTIDGSTSGAASSTGFASQFEAIKAMQDPRYGKDPAYRAQVDQRLLNRTY